MRLPLASRHMRILKRKECSAYKQRRLPLCFSLLPALPHFPFTDVPFLWAKLIGWGGRFVQGNDRLPDSTGAAGSTKYFGCFRGWTKQRCPAGWWWMGTLGSPSRTEPPEMPVPGTAARKASCEAKKGDTRSRSFHQDRKDATFWKFHVFPDLFKGKNGSWPASQVKEIWPLSPSGSRVASLRASDFGVFSSHLCGTSSVLNWLGEWFKSPDLHSLPGSGHVHFHWATGLLLCYVSGPRMVFRTVIGKWSCGSGVSLRILFLLVFSSGFYNDLYYFQIVNGHIGKQRLTYANQQLQRQQEMCFLRVNWRKSVFVGTLGFKKWELLINIV